MFIIDRKRQQMYGTLAAVSADNLGSLALGGFKESCTAYRRCRQCYATYDTMIHQVRILTGYHVIVRVHGELWCLS